MGSGESRVHFPKGGVKGTAATAAKAMRSNAETVAVCVLRVCRRNNFDHSGTSFLSELDTRNNHEKKHFGRSETNY